MSTSSNNFLPDLTLSGQVIHFGNKNKKGRLANAYSPLHNLIDKNTKLIIECTTSATEQGGLNFDMAHPVDILVQDSYDGSVNLILNDDKNTPKLINSRFSVLENDTFCITDHIGFKDSNLYDEENFAVASTLIPHVSNILNIEYTGLIDNGGIMPCGVYTFYFKYCDSDNNLTAVLGESGLVYCHIGQSNNPSQIRLGMEEEKTDKAITFKLSNIDLGYTGVHVYYSKVSGNEEGSITSYYHIEVPFNVNIDGTCAITITGKENATQITEHEIYSEFASIGGVKTQTSLGGLLLFGNVQSTEHDYEELQRMSWRIYPSFCGLAPSGDVGLLTSDYKDPIHGDENKCIYYNTKNLYHRVGYWPEEYYRFGIVYIFEDDSISEVFDVMGVDFSKLKFISLQDLYQLIEVLDTGGKSSILYEEWKFEPESKHFYENLNSRGVVKMPKCSNLTYTNRGLQPRPLYIKFDLSNIGKKTPQDITTAEEMFKKHSIKGYYFVRLTRVPNILCLGLVILKTDKDRGSLPCLKMNNFILGLSFLNSDRMISHEGYFSSVDLFKPLALLSPDVLLRLAIFSDIFSAGEFLISPLYKCVKPQYVNGDYNFTSILTVDPTSDVIKTTFVPDGAQNLTNGVDYFSAEAGKIGEAHLTSDLYHIWDKSFPQDLSKSTTLVRGLWGSYVGLSENPILEYGQICNIYKKTWKNPELAHSLILQELIDSPDVYYAICDRQPIKNTQVSCYRGDCFISLYTHRMFRNFLDTEYPTNSTIINPFSWAQNYAVRCSAWKTNTASGGTFNNCKKENEGWKLTNSDDVYLEGGVYNQIAPTFVLDVARLSGISDYKIGKIDENGNFNTENFGKEYSGNEAMCYKRDGGSLKLFFYYAGGGWQPHDPSLSDTKPMFASDILFGLTQNSDGDWTKYTFLEKPDPPKKTGLGLIDAIVSLSYASRHDFQTRELVNINRGDVNAVGLGQWVTFPACAGVNYAMRDLDFRNTTEEARYNQKRSFYPHSEKNRYLPLADSYCINNALKTSLPSKKHLHIPYKNYFKQEFFTRVYYSMIDNSASETNEWKQMYNYRYIDYDKQYGAITKMIESGNVVYIIFEHAIAAATLSTNQLNEIVLGGLNVLNTTYGSKWKDSIIKTPFGVYGVDTVAKAIWRITGEEVSVISTRRVNKFLIDFIDLSEFTRFPYIGHVNVKTHFNANKNDLIFTYYNDTPYSVPSLFENKGIVGINSAGLGVDKDGKVVEILSTDTLGNSEKLTCVPEPVVFTYDTTKQGWKDFSDTKIEFWIPGTQWALCYNIELDSFITFYDWIPVESSNIDNIFFSFNKEDVEPELQYHVIPKFEFVDVVAEVECKHNGNFIEAIKVPIKKAGTISKAQVDSAFNYNIVKYKLDLVNLSLTSPSQIPNLFISALDVPVSDHATHFSFYFKSEDDIALSINGNEVITANNSSNNYENWRFCVGKIEQGTSTLSIKITSTTSVEFCELRFYTDLSIESPGIIYQSDQNKNFDVSTYLYRMDFSQSLLWKHGQAGIYDSLGKIKPTHWYGKQHEFNFEFVVNDTPTRQKVFNNLKILSNKAAPAKFEYEVVGEGYEWFEFKPIVEWVNKKAQEENPGDPTYDKWFKEVLGKTSSALISLYPDFPSLFDENRVIQKLPYLKMKHTDKKGTPERPHYKWDGGTDYWGGKPYNTPNKQYTYNCSEPCLVEDDQLNETRIRTESLGNDVRKYGRIRGNMQYLEDLWDVEIRPIQIEWCYLDYHEELKKKKLPETRHRDKYIKIKVRYSGEDLALIQLIYTIFDESYA